MPSLAATACAVARLSPVSMTMRMPSASAGRCAAGVVGLIGSATAMMPAGLAVDRDEHRRRAFAPQAIGPRLQPGRRRIPSCSRSCALPSATWRPPIRPATPLPVNDVKSAISRSVRPRSRAQATMAAASGCSLERSRLAASDRMAVSSKPSSGRIDDHARLAFGQRAGLVDDQRVDFLETLQRLGVPDQDSRRRPFAHAHHDRHRRRQAEGARAGDDQDGDGGDQGVGKRRRRSPDHPGGEGQHRHGDDRGHEPGGHHVGQALDRRAAALRLGDHVGRCAPAWCRSRPFRPASPARPCR